jgi:YesN/AraC family two-component response regulator
MSAVLDDDRVLEQTALSVREKVSVLRIVDQASYDIAAAEFSAAAHLEKQITEHYAPLKQKAHEAHKAICSAEKEMLTPVLQAKQTLSRMIGVWDNEQERIRREEQRRLEEEARKRAEEESIQNAIDAEEAGADEEEIEVVLTTPGPVSKVQAAPTYQKSISTRENWSSQVVSLAALVKAAAQNPAYLCYLQANETALGAAARSQKTLFNVPGCKAVVERVAMRGRR